MKPNTNYGIRIPTNAEIMSAFGSMARCDEITGGDLPTILFYLANPDRIEGATKLAPQPDDYAREIHEAALSERAAEAWDSVEKPTIKAVSETLGVCRPVARRALVNAQKVPA